VGSTSTEENKEAMRETLNMLSKSWGGIEKDSSEELAPALQFTSLPSSLSCLKVDRETLLEVLANRLRARFPSLSVGLKRVEGEASRREGKGEGKEGGGVACWCRSLSVRCVGDEEFCLIFDVRWSYQDEDIAELFRDVIVGMAMDIKRHVASMLETESGNQEEKEEKEEEPLPVVSSFLPLKNYAPPASPPNPNPPPLKRMRLENILSN